MTGVYLLLLFNVQFNQYQLSYMLFFMQSIAMSHAKLCDAPCKALRYLMQSFAITHARHYYDFCNSLP